MRVYLIQHGLAKSKDEDATRPLTEQGLAESWNVAAFVTELRLCVKAIWQSGKTRAAQTAEVFAGAFGAAEGVVRRGGLAPNDDVAPVAEAIERAEGDLVLVGHMPFLSKLAARLLLGKESPEPISFRNSGVVCLRRGDEGAWQVAWIATPDLLAKGT